MYLTCLGAFPPQRTGTGHLGGEAGTSAQAPGIPSVPGHPPASPGSTWSGFS